MTRCSLSAQRCASIAGVTLAPSQQASSAPAVPPLLVYAWHVNVLLVRGQFAQTVAEKMGHENE